MSIELNKENNPKGYCPERSSADKHIYIKTLLVAPRNFPEQALYIGLK